MSGLRVFNSAVQSFFDTQKNLQEINTARERANQQRQAFDLDKKIATANLERAKLQNQMTENDYRIQNEQLKTYFKQQEDIRKGKEEQINQAEAREVEKAKQAEAVSQKIMASDPIVQGHVASILEPINVGGHVNFRQQRTAKPSVSRQMTPKAPAAQRPQKLKDSDEYAIFEAANKLAQEDWQDEETPYDQKVMKYLPKAREMLTGVKPEKKKSEYSVGQIIPTRRGKVKVVGYDDDGTPLIEPIQ